ncbi:S-adenosyl-L-methionine dependent methyltransferase [Punctularia strigosozonata HHB-11173 SS5]|uniref:S-adenosyl-L-methionine dependent methyltransferase n=1 Tax=Punctularia strigosozonata (strain HHB-11173) TaxID=741275 RepID=UPI00044170CB|nr:S-adenosyl-L-methionine dependent methyltransferase [Punctularia strigosozonata HHB-11173 SS5]EIN14691.1 S-adenosyl-L-methionine dependent methyltransferase [Punctularia strigosozonata HHB-11173 SS5]
MPGVTDPSASVYSLPLVLAFIYEFWVLRVSNSFAWHCPTSSVLLPFFQAHLTKQPASAHLDAGVGTGFYPARGLASTTDVPGSLTLLDLNPDTLESASRAVKSRGYTGEIQKKAQSVFDPVPAEMRAKFASISLFYLLHCLPGAFPEKATRVAEALAPALAPGPSSVLYGATILGKGVRHNWLGNWLMNAYNKRSIFGNARDSADGLREGLQVVFRDVDVQVVGRVALFVCRKPRAEYTA